MSSELSECQGEFLEGDGSDNVSFTVIDLLYIYTFVIHFDHTS